MSGNIFRIKEGVFIPKQMLNCVKQCDAKMSSFQCYDDVSVAANARRIFCDYFVLLILEIYIYIIYVSSLYRIELINSEGSFAVWLKDFDLTK